MESNLLAPHKSIMSRYSLKAMAESKGLTEEQFKNYLEKEIQLKQKMIDDRLAKGYTLEQATNETLRCLYIPGFSGPTFKD
jgi:hypothetical protein